MSGEWPRTSTEVFLRARAYFSSSSLQISVERVRVALGAIGLQLISPPIPDDEPVMTLNTPFGTPARSASSASASAENGVALAGLDTIGQPAASAGPALRVIIAAGKFHGVIAAHTPTGSLMTTMRLS